jgi:hypothetical protein
MRIPIWVGELFLAMVVIWLVAASISMLVKTPTWSNIGWAVSGLVMAAVIGKNVVLSIRSRRG